ncbi:hypothetical protein BH09PLA1_BH09PLA1_27370 [soil metagenome]
MTQGRRSSGEVVKRGLNLSALRLATMSATVALACGAAQADFTSIVKTGVAVPGQGTSFTNVNIAGVDTVGGAAFVGSFTIGATNYSGLYHKVNNVISPLADRGTLGPAGETINSIIAAGDYENGVIVFAANTSAGRTLYRYTPGTGLAALVREGDVLPGSSSPVSTFYNRGVAGDANEFAFGTARSDASTALFTSISGFPVVTADDKTRSPIAETGDFINFPELHYRNGHTAFVGTGADPDWPGPGPAPVEPAGVFISSPGNPLEIVAGRNFEIPGGNGLRFREFERPRIMPDNRVAFAGGIIDEEDPEGERHMGVFILNPDLTWKKYIDSEMLLPGLHDGIAEFNQYSLETDVNYFGVNDLSDGSYIYYESAAGVFTKLVDSYETLDGKALARIRMLGDTALNGGELYFRADFTDGTSGIYRTSVPEPASLGIAMFAAAGVLARRRPR